MSVVSAPRLLAARDSVFAKAFLAYGSASWVLLQIVSTFIQGLGLPNWVFTGFLWILIAGVPMVAFVAYSVTRNERTDVRERSKFNFGRLTFRHAAFGGGAILTFWVFLVGVFMASWAFGIGPAASLFAAGTLKQSDPVLISEFTNHSKDPLLARTVTEAIRVDLAQSNLIRVFGQDDVGDALKRMSLKEGTALDRRVSREVAVREGLAGLLEGDVSSLGPATLISAKLINPRTGVIMAEYHERAKSEDELLDAVDRLASTIRNKIGEPLTKLRDEPPLAKVTTASMPALQAYTAANAAHASGKKEEAVVLLRQALALDSSFPMAWRKLGVLINDDDRTGARAAYTNAYKLRDDLPERERDLATASYFKNVVGDLQQSMAAYRRVLHVYQDDETALTNLANLYTAFQQPEPALKLLLKSVKNRPRFAAYSNLFNTYIRLGQLDQAAEMHRVAAKLFPDQKRVKFQPIILAYAKGQLGEADSLMAAFLKANASKPELVNDLFVARYEWKRGRLERAREIFTERVRLAVSKDKPVNAIEAMTSLVALARAQGNLPLANEILAQAANGFPLSRIEDGMRPYLDLAEAYALAGNGSAARSYLSQAEGQGVHDTLDYDQKRRVIGLIAMAEGRYGEAVTILRGASGFGQCSTCLLFDLGLAQEKAGMVDEAVETYRRYARMAPLALGRGEQLGFVLMHLASLQEKAGDLRSAEATRVDLNRHWAGTDRTFPSVRGQVRAAS